jgi:hypothetical protein
MEDKRWVGNGWSRESSVSMTGSSASYFSPFDKLERKIEKKVSNQSMKPTQHFVISFRLMRTPIVKVLGGLSVSR